MCSFRRNTRHAGRVVTRVTRVKFWGRGSPCVMHPARCISRAMSFRVRRSGVRHVREVSHGTNTASCKPRSKPLECTVTCRRVCGFTGLWRSETHAGKFYVKRD